MKNYEDPLNFKYSILDLLVPLGPTRYMPRILREQDGLSRYAETALNAMLTSANMMVYEGLAKILIN